MSKPENNLCPKCGTYLETSTISKDILGNPIKISTCPKCLKVKIALEDLEAK